MSLQRVASSASHVEPIWIGPTQAVTLDDTDRKVYDCAHKILCHLAVQAPTAHASGHPGGPLSAFTFAYWVTKRRDPSVDQPLRYSAGHLSVLAYGLQWLFGKSGDDPRLASPQAIIEHFRTASGLPGHVEAGIGDIPFGTGPLGKGLSHALGAAFALKYQKKPGMVDVLLADGDAQEGQVAEALRLASRLRLDNLVAHVDLNDIQLSDMPSRTVAADLAAIAAACGWQVIEVQNGNDPAQVVAALDSAAQHRGNGRPVFVCYYTTMGHGVALMEEGSNTGAANYHGAPLKKDVAERIIADLPPLDGLIKAYEPIRKSEAARAEKRVATDVQLPWSPKGYKRAVTAEKGAARKDIGAIHLKALMQMDQHIIVLHADLAGSGGFDAVHKAFPDRVINVGVAEANMVMMAAGMRQTGLLPVTYTFAAFGTNEARANARLIDINCGHTRCGVLHNCTHAGIGVGEDGETHQEQNYLALPYRHTRVWAPVDSNQAAAMVERALEIVAEGHESVYLFSGRDNHPQVLKPDGTPYFGADYRFTGAADMVRGHGDTRDALTVIALGASVHDAIEAADSLSLEIRNPKSEIRILAIGSVRPIDAGAIVKAALETRHLIVVEDHNVDGGLATQVADIIADFQLPCSLRRLGLTQFFPSASAGDLKIMAGIDAAGIADSIQDELRAEVCGGEDVLVTTLHRMPDMVRLSRFGASVAPYIGILREHPEQIDALRKFWRASSCPPEKLPSTEQLLRGLEDVPTG
ncbi:MAG: transketolase [Candidatus Peregrinibacteria bacterium Gr01-1014_25]|nr:MAG: transketolase [Candidatus Peregrinibacteria bacterium Gr01-1014_25]